MFNISYHTKLVIYKQQFVVTQMSETSVQQTESADDIIFQKAVRI